MFPARFAPYLFGFFLSGMMSCIVSGIATLRAVGFVSNFPTQWLGAWMMSFAVSFPVVLLVGPLTRRLVARLVRPVPVSAPPPN